MVTTPPLTDCVDPADHRGDVEFLVAQVGPLLGRLRAACADPLEGDRDRLLAARDRLEQWLGEAIFAHLASGGSIRVE
jgi:hypothetical protein